MQGSREIKDNIASYHGMAGKMLFKGMVLQNKPPLYDDRALQEMPHQPDLSPAFPFGIYNLSLFQEYLPFLKQYHGINMNINCPAFLRINI